MVVTQCFQVVYHEIFLGDLFFLSIQCTPEPLHVGPLGMFVYVVVQFYPVFKFFFPLFWGMVMHS